MLLAQGAVSDRPWGLTLGALGVARRTVQLTVRADERVFRIELDRGVVITASSPLAADSIARVALTSGLITPAQVDEVKRRLTEAPQADEVGVVAVIARLSLEQACALRRKLIAQRAARTFSVERGTYAIEERGPRPAAPVGAGVDVRLVVYTGARTYLSELRLALELRQLGKRFALKPDALEELPRYSFTLVERPIIEALRRGTSLAELEANQRDLDPRVARAVLYALASCDALLPAEQLGRGSGAMAPIVVPAAPAVPAAAPAVPVPPVLASATDRARTALGGPAVRPLSPQQPQQQQQPPRAAAAAPSRLQPRTSPPRPKTSTLGSRLGPRAVPPRLKPRTVPPRLKPRTVPPPAESAAARPRNPAVSPPAAPPPAVPPPAESAAARPRSPAVPPPMPPRTPPMPPRPATRVSTRAPTRSRPDTEVDFDFEPASRSMLDRFPTSRITAVRPNPLAAHEVTTLIAERTAMLDRGVDHFALLGLEIGASAEDVHAAYVELARNLRQTRLDELGISDESFAAQRLLAQAGIAFTVLTDRILRPAYMASLEAAHR
jgi:hypothetical protein